MIAKKENFEAPHSLESIASRVEYFKTPKERSVGLLKFDSAPEQYAAVFDLALFGFLPVIHTFGMKFPIDIVFCDRDKRVQHVFKNVGAGRLIVPWRNLLGGCPYLLEFSGCDTSQVREGDLLSW